MGECWVGVGRRPKLPIGGLGRSGPLGGLALMPALPTPISEVSR